jgi:hypothetical protein
MLILKKYPLFGKKFAADEQKKGGKNSIPIMLRGWI